MESYIYIGIAAVLALIGLGIWYIMRDQGGPDLNSSDWSIGDMDSTNERDGDER